jgi:HEAT repeat protein
MDKETLQISLMQPALFDFAQTTSGAVELFPEVWGAMEDLIAPQSSLRLAALERLVQLQAPRLSGLVAYLLATRLTDPELTVRLRVIQVLSEIFSPDERGQSLPESVHGILSTYLAGMDPWAVSCLVKALVSEPSIISQIARLLNYCPDAASHLVDILTDRKASLQERCRAAELIGKVGYLEALPALERLQVRLAARLRGQQSMPFAPLPTPDEAELLPVVEQALSLLSVR